MVEVTGLYEGQKHCELTHRPSGSKIATDAPKDNNGRGELFSPTDLVAAALGSCALTVMGILADQKGYALQGARVRVQKEMTMGPRRIHQLLVEIEMPPGLSAQARKELEQAAHNCPVHKSLHPDIEAPMVFHYPD